MAEKKKKDSRLTKLGLSRYNQVKRTPKNQQKGVNYA